MQTFEQISQRLTYLMKTPGVDFSQVQVADILEFLPYEHAKEHLKEGVDVAEWGKSIKELTPSVVISEMRSYMRFALDKAKNHRGLSADRSVQHFKAWLWLLENGPVLVFADDDENYSNYGAPILRRICEEYHFNMPVGEMWFDNMSQGEACFGGCDEGCG